MSKSIKVSLFLEGATKFNSDIRGCNSSLKQFQSELKMTTEQFRNNENSYEALSRKSEILQKSYDSATKKVETYKSDNIHLASSRIRYLNGQVECVDNSKLQIPDPEYSDYNKRRIGLYP